MFKRILVPLDGSKLAERAIQHAEQFARIFDSDIILLQVLDPAFCHSDPGGSDPLSWQICKTEADVYLQQISSQLTKNLGEKSLVSREEDKKRVEYCIREGKVSENIVDFAQEKNIELTILSTHGAGGFSRWNLNSVIQKVVSMIYLPILIVRCYDQPEIDESSTQYNRIMFPIDGSRRAEWVLSIGEEFAKSEIFSKDQKDDKSKPPHIILLTVIQPHEFPIPAPLPDEIRQLSDQSLRISHEAVNKYLSGLKERLPVDSEVRIVENSSIVSAIHEQAEKDNIDLVVMCAHGYSGQIHYPYGSVTRNYLEHGNKNVLIVQDTPLSQVKPSHAQIAAEKSGRR